jgi:hypothetical protein
MLGTEHFEMSKPGAECKYWFLVTLLLVRSLKCASKM